ncbi:MAG: LamG domain-containing protein [Bacteroidales bacterium]
MEALFIKDYTQIKVPLNEWIHLAATWDGDSMSVFINGTFDKSLDVSTLGSFFDPAQDTIHIGAREISSYFYDDLDGLVDEIRIWNIARTESEIQQTMHNELTGNESGLVAYYKLNNEGTGIFANQKIIDSGPNGFNGTLGPDSTTASFDPSWTNSTSPVPYYTVQDGNWNADAAWATGALAPGQSLGAC